MCVCVCGVVFESTASKPENYVITANDKEDSTWIPVQSPKHSTRKLSDTGLSYFFSFFSFFVFVFLYCWPLLCANATLFGTGQSQAGHAKSNDNA